MNYYRLAKHYWRVLRDRRKKFHLQSTLKNHDQKPSDQQFNPKNIKTVAVFLWHDKLGDTFVSTVFAQAIKAGRPDIHLTYIVGGRSNPLLDGCTAIDRIWVVGKRSWKTAGTLVQPSQIFDLVVEMDSSMSALDFMALKNLGAKHYLGFEKQAIKLFDVNVSATDTHFVNRYLAAARILTQQPTTVHYFIPWSDQSANQAASFQKNISNQLPYFLLNLFGSGKFRRFDATSAKKLIGWLLLNYPEISVALLRVPGQDLLLNLLVTDFGSDRLTITPVPASIPLTFELIKNALVVLSPDTAVVHFCNAWNQPLVAIYQKIDDNFSAWKPFNANAQTIFARASNGPHDRVSITDFSYSDLASAIDTTLHIATNNQSKPNSIRLDKGCATQ